jgi:hypothetical protein
MHAQPGNWLIIEQADVDHEGRRGLIEDVPSPDGEPPFQVRWLDTGHKALVFPEPGAHVATWDELNAVGAVLSTRPAKVRQEIAEHRRRS